MPRHMRQMSTAAPSASLPLSGILTCLCGMWLAGCSAEPVAEISATSGAAAAATSPIAVAPDDWPWWRGPSRNGIAEGPPPPTNWSATHNILWATDIPGRGHSSPIVVGDRVYLATADEGDQTQSVVALNAASGEILWRSEVHQGNLPTSGMHAKSTHANGTIACDGAHLYIGFLNNGEIHATCLDRAGEIQWQTPLGPFTPQFGYAPSPVIHEGLVIFAADNPGSGYIAAVHRESGDIVWRKPRRAGTSYATANILESGGRPRLVIGGLESLVSFDPLTGDQQWSCDGLTEAVVGTAVSEGDLVFASGGYPGSATLCVNAATGKEVWHNDVKAYEPSMLVLNGHLYSYSQGGILYCWNAATGAELWKKRIGGDVSASLVAHGDLLFATNEAGQTTVFRANPAQYEELAQNQLGTEGFASPAICRGRIYIRTATGDGPQRQETLYCIGQ